MLELLETVSLLKSAHKHVLIWLDDCSAHTHISMPECAPHTSSFFFFFAVCMLKGV